jgi:predicted metal-binding protein
MPICPYCKGHKQGPCFVDRYNEETGKMDGELRVMPCFECGCSGEVSDQRIQWMKVGEQCRQARLKRDQLTLRKIAERYNLTPSAVSEMERGVTDPTKHPYYDESMEADQ